MASTVDAEEVERFSRLAGQWWDRTGKFKPLHDIGPLRVSYILEQTGGLSGKTLLDIGCGGGLIAEPMADSGAKVTAIDASAENIETAKLHAKQSGLAIDYRNSTAETLAAAGERFDVVVALEIVEHVADIGEFVKASAQLLKPGGTLVYSTLNRTVKSYALGIVAAEYVLNWVPRGTHTWQKFLKPAELARHFRANGIEMKNMTGMVMSPLDWKWRLDAKDLGVNYLMSGVKEG